MSGVKLTGTTEMCTVLLPGCRAETRISWVFPEHLQVLFLEMSVGIAPYPANIQSQPGRYSNSVNVIWARRSPKPGGDRQTGRQTDQSNSYGPSLKMLETPDISLLVRTGYFVLTPLLYTPRHGSYFFKVTAGTVLVC